MTDSMPLPGTISPYLNASGFFGYTPSNDCILADHLGAFVTPPISKTSRSPAANRCLVEYPGGFLLHTGLPNESFNRIIKHYRQKWSRLKVPVWAHLVPQNAWECQQMVRACEEFENVTAVEISLPGSAVVGTVEEWLQAAVGELPIYVCVPFNARWEDWLGVFTLYNVSGIVLSAPRGSISNNGSLVTGRLYGPSLFPQMLSVIHENHDCGIPLIAGSGIFSLEHAEIALRTGASAVQFDARLWQLMPLTFPDR